MAEIIQAKQARTYADPDNRVLSGSPQRVAVSNLPVVDLSPFTSESSPEDRRQIAGAIRSACIDIGFFYVTGHGFTVAELDAVLSEGRNSLRCRLRKK